MEEEVQLSLGELSKACSVHAEYIVELVEEGIIEPVNPRQSTWIFQGHDLERARTTVKLQRDLDVNLAGAALAIDLIHEIEVLKAQLKILRNYD